MNQFVLLSRNRWTVLAEETDFTDAQTAAWSALCQAWGGAENFVALPSTAVYHRSKDTGTVGWRTYLLVDYLGRDRHLDILVGREFPTQVPQLWVEPNPFLVWPHAESNGKLCLWLK